MFYASFSLKIIIYAASGHFEDNLCFNDIWHNTAGYSIDSGKSHGALVKKKYKPILFCFEEEKYAFTIF